MTVPAGDRAILRRLAEELAAIAALPVQQERAELWRRVNDLSPVRPTVWINEIPWHEMNVGDELTLRCESDWARGIEGGFRRTLYQWRHLPDDTIVSDYLPSPLAIRSTGMGIAETSELIHPPGGGPPSRRFVPQIVEPADIEKIKFPEISLDEAATAAELTRRQECCGDILPVRPEGIKHIWYTPWDNLIRYWGVEQAMFDMIDRPAMVNDAVERFAAAMCHQLDQYEALGLLSFGANNTRVGSGGYGHSRDLPGPADPARVVPSDNWGCSNAQIFSEVSPDFHWEFALRHDLPWLSRWGLNYYGCCEQLDAKVDILRRIPRLRKISMNYRIKLSRAVETVGSEFAFSYKPNPAFFAERRFRLDEMRAELEQLLTLGRGCSIEIIMKDISTVANDPQRLWAWAEMARELVEAAV